MGPQTRAGKVKLGQFFKDEKAATLTTIGRTPLLKYLKDDGISVSCLKDREIFVGEEGAKRVAETSKSDWVLTSFWRSCRAKIDVFASRVDALNTKGAVIAWKSKGPKNPAGDKTIYATLHDQFTELGYTDDVEAGKALKAAGGWKGRNVIVLRKH